MNELKVTAMSFEEQYSDGSGVEYRVTYDSTDANREIKFESGSKVSFPAHKINWLIASLERIRTERSNVAEESQ